MEQAEHYPDNMADTTLEKMLNLTDKGADVIIFHPGSHSLKFGLASQVEPFVIPNVIAHRMLHPKANQPVVPFSFTFPGAETSKEESAEPQTQIQLADYIEQTLEQRLSNIKPILCRHKYLTVDQERPKYFKKGHGHHDKTQPLTINHKPLAYQVFHEENAITQLPENPPHPPEKWLTDPGQLISTSLNDQLENNFYSFLDISGHPAYLIGQAALNTHINDPYLLQWPIKNGYFNVSTEQGIGTVLDNIERIFSFAITERLKIGLENLKSYSVILVIPDLFNKGEIKSYLDILLRKLKFKSAYLQQESVLASFAYALQYACVVDIGAQKTSVCCVDEGSIISGSIIRRNFAGDDITFLLHRLLIRENSLHYFPKKLININDHYHFRLIEKIKENNCSAGKSPPDPVKAIKMWIHDKGNKTTQVNFNLSDALVITPFSLFYCEMLEIVNPKYSISSYSLGHLELGERNPEDIMQILISEVVNEGKKPEDEKNQKKKEEVKEASNDEEMKDESSVLKEDSRKELELSRKVNNTLSLEDMNKPTNLEELICGSLMKVDDPELRKRLANSILLIGGSSKFKDFMDTLEEKLVERLSEFTNNIDRVEVVNNSSTQKKSMDNRFLSWIGASIIPKIDITKDMFILREKWVCDVPNYYGSKKNEIEDIEMKGDSPKAKSEITKKGKKNISADGGIKFIREKCPFIWE